MKFRPCIDIHNGRVKQIVGQSLSDEGNKARDNFVSNMGGAYYAGLYREKGLKGGHVILLNPASSSFYEEDMKQAGAALNEYPGGLMIGGGVRDDNAMSFIRMGASHVIVSSFIFENGEISPERLDSLKRSVGREHLVLDLSCKRSEGGYYVVSERWQRMTKTRLNKEMLRSLEPWCSEFLIHGTDVEGMVGGIDEELVALMGEYEGLPVTYAGGISSMEDILLIEELGRGRLDFTAGSSLDIFGGELSFEEICGKYTH